MPSSPPYAQGQAPFAGGFVVDAPGASSSNEKAEAPPAYQPRLPQGVRVPLDTNKPFDPSFSINVCKAAPFQDLGGEPVWVGSAMFKIGDQETVQPCKICPYIKYYGVRVPYGGKEHVHSGRYDLLPIGPDMEWVETRGGQIPKGRTPIDGGFETNGARLYHAYGSVDGVDVPGKTGEHLGAAHLAYGDREHTIRGKYYILCWRGEGSK